MSAAFAVRAATPDDVPAICRLGQVLNAMHAERYPRIFTGPGDDPERDAPHWRECFGPGRTAFVAELQDRRVIGFATARTRTDESPLLSRALYAQLDSICVDPGHRRLGAGRALAERVEQWAREQGAHDLVLNVMVFNENARSLYRMLGFEDRFMGLGKPL